MGTKLDDNIARGLRIGPARDSHGQRFVNAADARDGTDLVTLRQLRAMLAGITPGTPGTQVTTNITNNNTYNGTGPFYDNGSTNTPIFTLANGFKHKVTISGLFIPVFSGFTDGDEVKVWILDATGGQSLLWPFGTRAHTNVMPDVANAELFIQFCHDGSGMVEQYATSYF